MSVIGKRIRELRQQKGVTMQQLADNVPCGVQYIQLLETGKIPSPRIDRLMVICHVLNITIGDLFQDITLKKMGISISPKVRKSARN